MSTLHQCHWQNRRHCQSHLPLMNTGDNLVVYGVLSQSDIDWLDQQLAQQNITWHLVIGDQNPHNAGKQINHQQWLQLILEHRNSWAWK